MHSGQKGPHETGFFSRPNSSLSAQAQAPLSDTSAQAINKSANLTSTSYRSPRLSPLHKFDTMISDSNKKVHSEFPFAKRPTKNFKYEQSSMSFPVEVIEEDKAEAEHQVSLQLIFDTL